MKTVKTMISLMALSIFSLNVIAMDGEPSKKEHPDKYCAKMKDGKLAVMHENMEMTSEVTLSNGTKVHPDGTITKKDGSKTMLKEGQCVDMDGKVMKER